MVQDKPVTLPNFPQGLLDALRCPICGSRLRAGERQLLCSEGHAFDQAKQGYLALNTGRRLPEGDTPAMVEARTAIQSAGLFTPVDHELGAVISAISPLSHRDHPAISAARSFGETAGNERAEGAVSAKLRPAAGSDRQEPAMIVADLGAGTGHYLAAVLDGLPGALGLAMDVSKPALRRAARVHPRVGAVLADTWGTLPLAGASVDLLLNVFAPRNGAEMRRVLRPGGTLLIVTPTEGHLAELRTAVGMLEVDPAKQDRLEQSLAAFTPTSERLLSWTMRLDSTQAAALVGMGPSARHLDETQTAQRLALLPEPITVTAAVRLSTFA
jgi:23S rRNA (guanine745-N1)-methyltransferase